MQKKKKKKNNFWQNDSFVNLAIFSCFAFAQIAHTRGSQLVPELLLKLSDTLHIQYRYIEHVHEEVSCKKKKILFSKIAAYLT